MNWWQEKHPSIDCFKLSHVMLPMQCDHLIEETMQEHPKLDDRAMRNVVASYVRDGYSQKDAVREAQKWRERMAQSAEMIRQGNDRVIAKSSSKQSRG